MPPFPLQNCPFLWGSELPSNTWFLGPTRVFNPNGNSISAAISAGLTSMTDRPTDRPRYSVGNNRPRCSLIIIIILFITQQFHGLRSTFTWPTHNTTTAR